MKAPVRKLVNVSIRGSTYECIPGPALISAVEARPRGIPMREAVTSLRLTDHAWVLFCALLPHVSDLTEAEMIESVMADPLTYERASLDLCLETLSPEAARMIEGDEGEGEQQEPDPPPATSG